MQVMEGKLEEERRSFEERVLKFKQHVADLEKEAANTEETFRSQAEVLAETVTMCFHITKLIIKISNFSK